MVDQSRSQNRPSTGERPQPEASLPQQRPAWAARCATLAQKRAESEDRRYWQVGEDEAIPYSHRWIHVQKVVKLARWLAQETGADPEVTEAAAWLHDVCKGQPKHARRGAEEAARFLPETDFPALKIPLVVEAIRLHEGLVRPESEPPLQPIEAAVLWDADKLSKLGVQALMAATAAHLNPGPNLAVRRQESVNFVVQVLARTVTSMNTAPARQKAKERYETMKLVLKLWARDEAFLEAS